VIRMKKKRTAGDRFDFRPIGAAMRNSRTDEGWTQEEAAERLEIEPPHYQRLEKNGRYPSFDLFVKIVRLYQLSVDEFFLPHIRPSRSTARRRLDTLLDKLEDNELSVVESTAKALIRMREREHK